VLVVVLAPSPSAACTHAAHTTGTTSTTGAPGSASRGTLRRRRPTGTDTAGRTPPHASRWAASARA